MTEQILIRRDPGLIRESWTGTPNSIIRDTSVSIEARWLWTYINSHDGTFALKIDQMRKVAGVGRDKMRKMIKELEVAGYLTRDQKLTTEGYFGLVAYHLHNPSSEPAPGLPAPVNQVTVQPEPENTSPVATSTNSTGDVFTGAGSTGDGESGGNKKTISKKKKELVGAEAPRTKRGTRLPEDFDVTEAMRAWFAENCPRIQGQGREHTEEFKNHWTAQGGASAVKLDWTAAWRNWMIKANRWARTDGPRTPKPHGRTTVYVTASGMEIER